MRSHGYGLKKVTAIPKLEITTTATTNIANGKNFEKK
jgi:hypothetical protein